MVLVLASCEASANIPTGPDAPGSTDPEPEVVTPPAEYGYEIHELLVNGQAYAFTRFGSVVGNIQVGGAMDRPFYWRDGTFRDVGAELDFAPGSYASGINDRDEVVVTGRRKVPSACPNGWESAIWRPDGEPTYIGCGRSAGINNASTVLLQHWALWKDGSEIHLPPLPDVQIVSLTGLTDEEVIRGIFESGSCRWSRGGWLQGIWEDGRFITSPCFSVQGGPVGPWMPTPNRIGWALGRDESGQAVVLTPDDTIHFPEGFIPHTLNDSTTITGTLDGLPHLWLEGKLSRVDLPPSRWEITLGKADSRGRILASGRERVSDNQIVEAVLLLVPRAAN